MTNFLVASDLTEELLPQQSNSMPFSLSTLATLLLQPAVWIAVGLVAHAFVKSPLWSRRLKVAVAILAILFTNPWLFHSAMNRWEPAPVLMEDLVESFDDAIVLGGFTRLWASPADRLHLNGDGNRFAHAVELYHLGTVRRLVFVSGATTATDPPLAEADLAARTAKRFGVPAAAIVALNTSRNTGENAAECRAYYETQGRVLPRILLVTSAVHMRRAEASFRRAGLEVTPFPTDHRTSRSGSDRKATFSNTLLPSPETLFSWGTLFREMLGYVVYRATNRI